MRLKKVGMDKAKAIANRDVAPLDTAWRNVAKSEDLSDADPNNIRFRHLASMLLDSDDAERIGSLQAIWETSTNRVDVQQEYHDIQRLFDEAQFCNSAFQTWVSSWLAAGPSFQEFSQKFLPKNMSEGESDSFCRLYYEQPDCTRCWTHVFVSLNRNAVSRDPQVMSLARCYTLLTELPSCLRPGLSRGKSRSEETGMRYFIAKIVVKSVESGANVVELDFPFDDASDLSALCFDMNKAQKQFGSPHQDGKRALVLYDETLWAIMQRLPPYNHESLQAASGAGSACSSCRISFHIQVSPKLSAKDGSWMFEKQISHIIIVSDNLYSRDGYGCSARGTAADRSGKALENVDVRWTVISMERQRSGASDDFINQETVGFRSSDLALANAISATLFNDRWYDRQYTVDRVAAAAEDTSIAVLDALKSFEPVRIPVDLPPGKHHRGPIKQVSRTLAKVRWDSCAHPHYILHLSRRCLCVCVVFLHNAHMRAMPSRIHHTHSFDTFILRKRAATLTTFPPDFSIV
jgi:hypothetical protein